MEVAGLERAPTHSRCHVGVVLTPSFLHLHGLHGLGSCCTVAAYGVPMGREGPTFGSRGAAPAKLTRGVLVTACCTDTASISQYGPPRRWFRRSHVNARHTTRRRSAGLRRNQCGAPQAPSSAATRTLSLATPGAAAWWSSGLRSLAGLAMKPCSSWAFWHATVPLPFRPPLCHCPARVCGLFHGAPRLSPALHGTLVRDTPVDKCAEQDSVLCAVCGDWRGHTGVVAFTSRGGGCPHAFGRTHTAG